MDAVAVFEDFEIPDDVDFSQLKIRWNATRDDIDFDRSVLQRVVLHNGLDPEVILAESQASRVLARLAISVWYASQRRVGGVRDPIFEQVFAEAEAWVEFGPTRVQRSFGSVH